MDYNEPSTLVSALQGQDALIISLSVTAKDVHNKIVDAAAAANVPWILPNEWGVDSSVPAYDADVGLGLVNKAQREHIEKLGKSSWIGVACAFWYEYSLAGPGLFGIDIQDRIVTFFDDGNRKINTSTWTQTAKCVAELLSLKTLPDDEKDSSLTLSNYRNDYINVSSFTITQRDMFESVKRVTGTSDADWTIHSVPVKGFYELNRETFQKTHQRVYFGYMLYSRSFFPDNPCLLESRHELVNGKFGLPKEDLDDSTREAVRMAEEKYVWKLFGLADNEARDWLMECVERL